MSSVNGGLNIVKDGLVLYLDGANTRSYLMGSTWFDISKSENNGILTNGSTFSSLNGGCIVFDGVNDFIDLSAHVNNSLWNGLWSNGITFECVIRLNDPFPVTVDGRSIFHRSSGSAGSNYFNFSVQADRKLRLWIGTYVPAFSSIILSEGVIYHIIATWDLSNVRLYINGELDTTTPNNNVLTNATATVLSLASCSTAFSGWEFPGNIYNFKVYDRYLTESEILQNYNAIKGRFGI